MPTIPITTRLSKGAYGNTALALTPTEADANLTALKAGVEILDVSNPTLVPSSGVITVTFDRDKDYQYYLQTTALSIVLGSSGNLVGKCIIIPIGVTNTISLPPTWLGTDTFTNNKVNRLFLYLDANGKVYYSIPNQYIQDFPDSVAPSFTSNTVTSPTTTTATYNPRLNEVGIVYWLVKTNSTIPTKMEIQVGGGTGAVAHGSVNVAANLVNPLTITGLTASTTYYLFSYASDGVPNETAIQSAVSFGTIAADTVAPVATFSPANGSTNATIGQNITITLSEPIFTTGNVPIDNFNVSSIVVFKLTNSSGADVACAISISGNVITIDPTASMTNSQVYYVALLAVKDSSGNSSTTQSAIFTAEAFVSAARSLIISGTGLQSTAQPNNIGFSNGSVDAAFSVEFWTKGMSLNSVGSSQMALILKSTSGSDKYFIELYEASGGLFRPAFGLYQDSGGVNYILVAYATGLINPANWGHVVCTYNGNASLSGLKIYFNGTLLTLATGSGGTYGAMGAMSAQDRLYVAYNPSVGSKNYTGKLDNIGIWGKELTQTEVTESYNAGHYKDLKTHSVYTGNNALLRGYWPFDSSLNDAGSNGYNLSGGTNSYSTDVS